MNLSGIKNISIIKITDSNCHTTQDDVAIESPLEMRIMLDEKPASEMPLSITMRTPGYDIDLTIGFLFTEGIINKRADIIKIIQSNENVISVILDQHAAPNINKLKRHFYTSSSCGVCGKTSIDLVKTKTINSPKNSTLKLNHELLWRLQNKLKERQTLFARTGGIHAAALFDQKANLKYIREDVGRHNAVDKLIGTSLANQKAPLYNYFIMVSGRASFELIQKASMAGISILVAVGAPSSLAIELAEEQGMCLVGFLKNGSFNIYSSANRINYAGR